MTTLEFMNPTSLYLEIGQSSVKALLGNQGLELALERQPDGRLTERSRQRLTLELRGLLRRPRWYPRQRALCAIGARGVSLRRLTLPPSPKEELRRLLRLQIESEFPLSPDDLAWGYQPLGRHPLARTTVAGQDLVVVAVKREPVEEYADILAGCGLSPVFTLGALARSELCGTPAGAWAVLDIGRASSELITFDHDAPGAVRILSWGGEDLTRALAKALEISRDEAENLKVQPDPARVARGDSSQRMRTAIRAELEALARLIRSSWTGRKLFVTGKSARLSDLASGLAGALGDGVQCEPVETSPGEGRSAAILGLRLSCEAGRNGPPLTLQIQREKAGGLLASPALVQWTALAALLVVGCVSLRYADLLVRKPRLARKLSEIRVIRQQLPEIDRELSLLQYLNTNQPPYLDALLVIANAAPSGARVDALSMNRRGEVSLRGSVRDSQQAVDLRSKLIGSGFFSTVVVEEQTPAPDKQKTVVRITAQWKPANTRKAPAVPPPRPESEKPTHAATLTNAGTLQPRTLPSPAAPSASRIRNPMKE